GIQCRLDYRLTHGMSGATSAIVAVDQPPEPAEHRAFLAATAAGLRRSRDDAAGEARERQRLQPDFSGAAQRGEEKALAAKEGGFDATDVLKVVGNRGLEGSDATGIALQHFAGRERALVERATRVHEGEAVAGEPFKDAAFT